MVKIIALKLSKDGKCVIYLTERTIKNIRLISPKAEEHLAVRIPRDIELTILIENAMIYELMDEKVLVDGEEALPWEFDSARDLLVYAITTCENVYSYLDGELEIADDFTQVVSKYSYKNLFVLEFEEKFSKEGRFTHMKIILREAEMI